MTPGGDKYGFCPAKATWSAEAIEAFQTAVLSYEMKLPYTSGGLQEQPEWWLAVMGDFVPRYEQMKFMMRAQSILGSGQSKANKPTKGKGIGAWRQKI